MYQPGSQQEKNGTLKWSNWGSFSKGLFIKVWRELGEITLLPPKAWRDKGYNCRICRRGSPTGAVAFSGRIQPLPACAVEEGADDIPTYKYLSLILLLPSPFLLVPPVVPHQKPDNKQPFDAVQNGLLPKQTLPFKRVDLKGQMENIQNRGQDCSHSNAW